MQVQEPNLWPGFCWLIRSGQDRKKIWQKKKKKEIGNDREVA